MKPNGHNDIPSMQSFMLEESVRKHWQCIEKALTQYLNRPLTAEDALLVYIETQDEVQRIYYDKVCVGTLNGGWDTSDPNVMKYVWAFTFIK